MWSLSMDVVDTSYNARYVWVRRQRMIVWSFCSLRGIHISASTDQTLSMATGSEPIDSNGQWAQHRTRLVLWRCFLSMKRQLYKSYISPYTPIGTCRPRQRLNQHTCTPRGYSPLDVTSTSAPAVFLLNTEEHSGHRTDTKTFYDIVRNYCKQLMWRTVPVVHRTTQSAPRCYIKEIVVWGCVRGVFAAQVSGWSCQVSSHLTASCLVLQLDVLTSLRSEGN